MGQLARKNILGITPYKPGKPIEEVQRELGLREVIKLASNENPLGPSPKAIGAIRKALNGLNRYPDGSCFYLKQKLARRLGLDESNLIIGNGSDEIMVLALRAFVDEGDEVVVARPTFLIYELQSKVCGANVRTVPLKDFRYDLPAMSRAVTERTKLVFIANPDNPTGSYVTKKEAEDFMDGLPEDAIVFFDEAYFELVEAEDYPKTLKYLNNKNVIITRTFSKAYGLSGLRVGYGMARPEFISYLDRVREPFNVNSLAQAGAMAALDDDRHLERTRRAIREGKLFLYGVFDKLGLFYIKSAANFILTRVEDAANVSNKLLQKGIIVRHMKPWGLDDFIRVTIGTTDENRRFAKALRGIIK